MRKLTIASLGVLAATGLALAVAASAADPTSVKSENGRTAVKAPYTRVDTTPDRTKVRVNAPNADVRVDTEAGQVRIRVPYFSGNIRW